MSHESKQPLKIIPFCLKLCSEFGVRLETFRAPAYLAHIHWAVKSFVAEIFWDPLMKLYSRNVCHHVQHISFIKPLLLTALFGLRKHTSFTNGLNVLCMLLRILIDMIHGVFFGIDIIRCILAPPWHFHMTYKNTQIKPDNLVFFKESIMKNYNRLKTKRNQ